MAWQEATMTEWRYWSDGSYLDDCRGLYRTRGETEQQAYRASTDSWEDIPQDNGPNWPRTLIALRAYATGDLDVVPVAELDEWVAGNRRFRGVTGPFRSHRDTN
jgi:hypothetical protein